MKWRKKCKRIFTGLEGGKGKAIRVEEVLFVDCFSSSFHCYLTSITSPSFHLMARLLFAQRRQNQISYAKMRFTRPGDCSSGCPIPVAANSIFVLLFELRFSASFRDFFFASFFHTNRIVGKKLERDVLTNDHINNSTKKLQKKRS